MTFAWRNTIRSSDLSYQCRGRCRRGSPAGSQGFPVSDLSYHSRPRSGFAPRSFALIPDARCAPILRYALACHQYCNAVNARRHWQLRTFRWSMQIAKYCHLAADGPEYPAFLPQQHSNKPGLSDFQWLWSCHNLIEQASLGEAIGPNML